MNLAVIDTDVLVSALLTRHSDAATARVVDAVIDKRLIPLYSYEILREYEEVLSRPKFPFRKEQIDGVLAIVRTFGLEVEPKKTGLSLPRAGDLVFFEVAMEKRDERAWLVTGNLRHFPERWYIVTPAEMMAILDNRQ